MCLKVFLEFAFGSGLDFPDAPGGDVRLVVILSLDGRTSQSAKHGNLPDVGQGIRDRTLEELLRRRVERFRAREKVIKVLKCIEKAIDFLGPRQGFGIMPNLLALGEAQSPIE